MHYTNKKNVKESGNKVPHILGLDTSRMCSTSRSDLLVPIKRPHISTRMVRILEGFRTILDTMVRSQVSYS